MKNILAIAAFMTTLLCGALIAQSTTPPAADPGAAQPPAAQPVPQTSQAPAPQPTPTPQSSTPSTTSTPAASSAQPASGNSAQPSNGKKIAPGSVIPVQLTKTVDAKKAKTGDQVVAKVTQDMKSASGEVLVPKDTKVFGHVTEAQARSKDQKESQLAIAFDHAQTKDGQTMQMPMSIQAIVGQQNNPPANEGNDPAAAPAAGGNSQTGGGGRSPMAGGSTPPPSPSAGASGAASDTQAENAPRPPINAQTQGVVGLSNINLSPNSNATQGSVVTSDKNNVKLESGTLLLLRVNQ